MSGAQIGPDMSPFAQGAGGSAEEGGGTIGPDMGPFAGRQGDAGEQGAAIGPDMGPFAGRQADGGEEPQQEPGPDMVQPPPTKKQKIILSFGSDDDE